MSKRKKTKSEILFTLLTLWLTKSHWYALLSIYNANTHSEWFIHAVIKQATAI